MINISDMSFSYRKSAITIKKINLQVNKGDLLGVLGHNGAGKTTLFRLILGLLKPSAGSVLIDNKTNRKVITEDRSFFSYVPEANGIYEKLSAFENLKFRAGISGVYGKETKSNSEQLLKELKLINRADEKVGYWSNGMKKRLSLACALISDPKLLLLDEPTNGLDPESLEIITAMLKLKNNSGMTIIINSHDLYTVQELCSRIIVLQEGEAIYNDDLDGSQGSLKDFYLALTKEYDQEEKYCV